MTSTIVVDQVGDLSADTFDFESLEYGTTHDNHFKEEFYLKLTDPSTCPKEK